MTKNPDENSQNDDFKYENGVLVQLEKISNFFRFDNGKCKCLLIHPKNSNFLLVQGAGMFEGLQLYQAAQSPPSLVYKYLNPKENTLNESMEYMDDCVDAYNSETDGENRYCPRCSQSKGLRRIPENEKNDIIRRILNRYH